MMQGKIEYAIDVYDFEFWVGFVVIQWKYFRPQAQWEHLDYVWKLFF